MKTTSLHKGLFTGTALLVATLLFTSCEKNNIDDSGQFRLKVVNASPTAGPQSFTLAGSVLVNGGLNFTDASAYITSPSGTRLVGEFKNDGTNSVYSSGEIWTANNIDQTVYLAGKGSKARVKVYTDDLGSPNNGKAKIKFIDFSDDASSVIKVEYADGADLFTTLSRDVASGYKNVDAGTLTLKVSSVGSGDNIGNFTVTDLQAGKIYTLYLTDSANGGPVLNKVLHN